VVVRFTELRVRFVGFTVTVGEGRRMRIELEMSDWGVSWVEDSGRGEWL
jgi:hypothetical protein